MAAKGKDKEKDKAEEKEATEAEGGSGGNKKKLILLAAICLVLIIVSVIGTMFALDMFSGAEEEMIEADMVDETPEVVEHRPAIYYPLKPPIIVNFQARGRQRFLQAEVTLMMRDEAVVLAIEAHMPLIRNSLVLLFSGQVYEDLQTAEGKDILREEALAEIQRLLEQEIGQPGVEQVLFTNFVMQ